MRSFFTLFFIHLFTLLSAQEHYQLVENIPYIGENETDLYRRERCKLDIYYPDTAGYTTIVWFHGGGLETGEKYIPEVLKKQGYGVVAVNYRLSPHATHPAYIDDAAEAIVWTLKNIGKYGGDSNNLYVSGHSAGGYLALLVALDKSYLDKYGTDADQIRGWLPISGQTATHYTIRKELGLPDDIPIVDRYAPLNQVRKNTPPIVLITGDRQLELAARYEENAYLDAVLKSIGNDSVSLYELKGFDHGNVVDPACFLILDHIGKAGK